MWMMMTDDTTDGDYMTHAGHVCQAQSKASSLMKYGSSEFKGSPAGAVKCPPRDGDVCQSFLTPESFLSFFPVLLMRSAGAPCSGAPN